nr:hypothetical protein CPj0978 [imported] - Chlamydophila pneumoniae (strain J138) [Chlamydia pneumoniae]
MEVYSFHPAVRTSFQHRVMAALDAWFFLGGHRLKVVSLDSCNSGWAYQELVSISTTEKVLKLLSYLLVPIVIIALLIRCLLHSNFRIDVEKERWLKIRELGIDIESCKLPSSYVNQVSSFIWFEKDKSKRPRIDVDYHTLHSKDWVVSLSFFRKFQRPRVSVIGLTKRNKEEGLCEKYAGPRHWLSNVRRWGVVAVYIENLLSKRYFLGSLKEFFNIA